MEFTQTQMSEIISTLANGKEGFQALIRMALESLMKSERSVYNSLMNDVSNGFRDRKIYHQGHIFEIQVPRSRENNFYPMLLGILKEQEAEAHRLICSLYSEGLTTEQVGRISKDFYGKHYSKAQVSRILDIAREDVSVWLDRSLDKRYPIVYIDATYVPTRREESVSNEAYYVVLGVKEDGIREVLSIVNFPSESATNWLDVFNHIKNRGVQEINLFVCDGLTGIENSITKAFPGADIQLCTVHLKRNIGNKVKKKDKQEVMTELKQIFKTDKISTQEEAYNEFMKFILKWQKKYPTLKSYQNNKTQFYFTYYKYETEIRSMIYTTNWIERLNKDFKRVLKMRGAMPNQDSVILLMGNVAINKMAFKYPIYKFLDTNLFLK